MQVSMFALRAVSLVLLHHLDHKNSQNYGSQRSISDGASPPVSVLSTTVKRSFKKPQKKTLVLARRKCVNWGKLEWGIDSESCHASLVIIGCV